LLLSLSPVLFGNFAPPRLIQLIVNSGACFLKGERKSWVIGQPEKSLGSGDLAPEEMVFGAVDEIVKFLWFKRSSGLIDERRNVVLDSFRNVLNFLFFKNPFLIILSLF
jgi:hypothetical protein